jgi:hypothetical protein
MPFFFSCLPRRIATTPAALAVGKGWIGGLVVQ